MPDRWITTTEYALKYGLSRRTPWKWAREGKVQSFRKGKRHMVLDPEVMEKANPSSMLITDEDLMPYFRGGDVARLLGIAERTVHRYASMGKIGHKKIGNHRYYSVKDMRELRAIFALNKENPTGKEKRAVMLEWGRKRLEQNA